MSEAVDTRGWTLPCVLRSLARSSWQKAELERGQQVRTQPREPAVKKEELKTRSLREWDIRSSGGPERLRGTGHKDTAL